jgi:hypothetical protein
MNDYRINDGYLRPPPPAPALRVWGKKRGEPAALFEVGGVNRQEAMRMVMKQGFSRAVVEIK